MRRGGLLMLAQARSLRSGIVPLALVIVAVAVIGFVLREPPTASAAKASATSMPVVAPPGMPAIPVSQTHVQTAIASGTPAISVQDVKNYVSTNPIWRGDVHGTVSIARIDLMTVSQMGSTLHLRLSLRTDRPYYVAVLNAQVSFPAPAGNTADYSKVIEIFDAYTGNLMGVIGTKS
jgi:hypothetical protein